MAFSSGAVFLRWFCLAVVDAKLRRIPEGLNAPTGHQEASLSIAQQSFGVQARWRGCSPRMPFFERFDGFHGTGSLIGVDLSQGGPRRILSKIMDRTAKAPEGVKKSVRDSIEHG